MLSGGCCGRSQNTEPSNDNQQIEPEPVTSFSLYLFLFLFISPTLFCLSACVICLSVYFAFSSLLISVLSARN